MPTETLPWSIQDHLTTPRQQTLYLEAAVEAAMQDGRPEFLVTALGDIAKARGMTDVAEAAGVTREGLYKALSSKGDPRLSTLIGLLKALDLQLAVKPRSRRKRSSPVRGVRSDVA